MRVYKDWYIDRSIEIYSQKLIKSLQGMPDKDFEYEYENRAPKVIDRTNRPHSIESMERFNGQVKASTIEYSC